MTKLTRPVPLPRWKYHVGHTMTAAVVAFLALAFGASLLWATILGTLAWPLLHECCEGFFYDNRPADLFADHVSDFIHHQPLWVVYLLRVGEPVLALLTTVLIGALYWRTLDWSHP